MHITLHQHNLPTVSVQSAPPLLYPIPAPPPLYPMPAPPSPQPPPHSIQSPPPYAVPPPSQLPMYPSSPMLITHVQMPYQGVIVQSNYIPPQAVFIRDYMVWSIINVFLGGFILGIVAVILSSQTRKRKLMGDIQGAMTMSKLTLACNIIITIIGFAGTAFIIIYFVFLVSFFSAREY
jgi:hypothetical protein